MSIIPLLITIAILSAAGSYAGAWIAISRKKYIIRLDKEKEQATLEPVNATPGKAEFLEDAGDSELKEMDQEPAWKRFLKGFAKPAKEE